MEIYSIGFTQKSADQFFELLKSHGIRRLIDVRLNNISQLAGFSKRDDLAYFLRELVGAEYRHEPMLAPTQELLDAYKKQKGSWSEYESDLDDGALMLEHCAIDAAWPKVLDIVRVDLGEARPLPWQPENWSLTGAAWQRIDRLDPAAAPDVLDEVVDHDVTLLQSTNRKVAG